MDKERNLNFEKLVKGLQEQSILKKDFVVPANCMEMKEGKIHIINYNGDNKALSNLLRNTGISVPNNMAGERIILDPLPIFHTQIADKLNIPKRYYDKMLDDHVPLLDANVTHWLKKNGEVNYLIRTFIDPIKKTGVGRAMLSNRYLPIDNYDVLLAVLEAIKSSEIPPDFFNITGDITEKSFYARFTAPSVEINAPNLLKSYRTPDPSGEGKTGVTAGFVITNSEVGFSKFSITPRIVILTCQNGRTFTSDALSKVHLGVQMEAYSEIQWSEETKRKNYEVIISQVKDCIRKYISPEYLGSKIALLEKEASHELDMPMDTVQNVSTSLGISEAHQKSILNYFVKGADTSAFGVTQALTFYAHEDADPDDQYDLESKAVEIGKEITKYDTPFIRDKKTGQTEAPLLSN